MGKRFVSVWGEGPAVRVAGRPAAASMAADSESGTDGAGVEADLRALRVMRERGLISAEEHERRRAELLGG